MTVEPAQPTARHSIADGGVRRLRLRNQVIMLVFFVLIGLLIVALLSQRDVKAEWGRAFGTDHRIVGTVVDIVPNVSSTRTCTLSRVVLAWTESSTPRTGYLDVCSDEVGHYPRGGQVIGWATKADSRNDMVGVNVEGRAGATFGVVLDSLLTLGVLLVICGLFRQLVRIVRAPRTLAGQSGERMTVARVADQYPGVRLRNGARVVILAPADGGRRKAAFVTARRDSQALRSGDAIAVVALGRSLLRRRATGPVAMLRDADHQVFWSNRLRPDKTG